MGADPGPDAFPAARAVFQEVDDALSQKLSKLMRDGPIEDLTLTENAQPALMAVQPGGDPACWRASSASASSRRPSWPVAGLDEYSALCGGGIAITLADTALAC